MILKTIKVEWQMKKEGIPKLRTRDVIFLMLQLEGETKLIYECINDIGEDIKHRIDFHDLAYLKIGNTVIIKEEK